MASVAPPLKQSLYKQLKFKEIEVESIPLDQALEIYSIERISIIKIDVEGAEHLVLKGALKTLNKA